MLGLQMQMIQHTIQVSLRRQAAWSIQTAPGALHLYRSMVWRARLGRCCPRNYPRIPLSGDDTNTTLRL